MRTYQASSTGFVPAFGTNGRLMVSYARPKERHERALRTVSITADSFSQRVHGTTQSTGRVPLRNLRPKIGRNKRVSVSGGPVVKMKRSVLARQAMPTNYNRLQEGG